MSNKTLFKSAKVAPEVKLNINNWEETINEAGGVQVITGTIIGFVSGMLASFAGSVSGYVVRKLFEKIDSK
jgi:hypothetical protein